MNATFTQGYGDSCYQLGQQMGENMQVHKGDQMEAHLGENLGDAMGLIDKPINHQVLLVLYFMFPENSSL